MIDFPTKINGIFKYEICKRNIAFSKSVVKRSKKENALLLAIITKLEQDVDRKEKFDEYDKIKN